MLRPVRFLLAAVFACGVVTTLLAAPPESDLDTLKKQLEALQAQVRTLEAQVRALAARMPQATAPAAAPPPRAGTGAGAGVGVGAGTATAAATPSASYEAEAQAIVDEVVRLTDQGEADRARAKLEELRTRYPASKVAGQGPYFSNELEVIGKAAPRDWGVATWFQGQDQADLSGIKPTIVVFWEEWCPHCKDEMPKLQRLAEAHRAQGLRVIGLTKVTQTSTDEKVKAYLAQNGIRFPVGKESGAPSSYLNVKGIPAAAILKGGTVVWRGHPIRLTEDVVARWLPD